LAVALHTGATRFSRGADGDAKYVPADMTYYEWLKTQPKEFQDDVLGKTRGKLFREGVADYYISCDNAKPLSIEIARVITNMSNTKLSREERNTKIRDLIPLFEKWVENKTISPAPKGSAEGILLRNDAPKPAVDAFLEFGRLMALDGGDGISSGDGAY